MAYDRKYGRVATERGNIGEDEPVVVFRAQDATLPELLSYYNTLCVSKGTPLAHVQAIKDTHDSVIAWQQENTTKIPASDGAFFAAQ